MKKIIIDNLKTLFYAFLIAIVIRIFLFQPFYIPSSSMEPNLLIGDRLFVTKYTYGYSRHSFPFSPTNLNKRFFKRMPLRGDVVVFKYPADDRTDYIKRLIGLPGDIIQFIDGSIYLNNNPIEREQIDFSIKINCGNEIDVYFYEETLNESTKYIATYRKEGTMMKSDRYIVPENHFFFMGDNRDCSKDSRYMNSVGYVNFNNLVGKAQIIFFSHDKKKGNILKFWKWNQSIRFDRFFKKIK